MRRAHCLAHEVLLGHELLIHASIALLELDVGARHASLVESLAEVLLEI